MMKRPSYSVLIVVGAIFWVVLMAAVGAHLWSLGADGGNGAHLSLEMAVSKSGREAEERWKALDKKAGYFNWLNDCEFPPPKPGAVIYFRTGDGAIVRSVYIARQNLTVHVPSAGEVPTVPCREFAPDPVGVMEALRADE